MARGLGEWLWLAGAAVIVADSFLLMPSDAAMLILGLVYGPWIGGTLAGAASVVGGLVAFGAMRALGEDLARRVVASATSIGPAASSPATAPGPSPRPERWAGRPRQ